MLWHPTKWWTQEIEGNVYEWPGQGTPPGLLDSGLYDVDPILGPNPTYFQCLSCCCTPAKCAMPQEILMTISGFSGTLSSVDRPAAYGYGPSNVCNECAILWSGSESYWYGYTPECCKCRAREDFFWWPRNIVGANADGGDMCERTRDICNLFPSLCTGVAQPTRYYGRIAARFINPCPTECTDFVWSDYSIIPFNPDAATYSLVELTDCAHAPGADGTARQDYNCITQSRIGVVKNNDSYLPPPGFRGPNAINLLPLCDNKFWNDPTYYRFCVSGGFWCQAEHYNNKCYSVCGYNFNGGWYLDDNDFFYRLTKSIVVNDGWRSSTWCEESPTRCKGPVPVGDVNWKYFRPKYVLISQPSFANCAGCPSYGFGYGSSFSNYGQGTDWYDPYDDGNCIGKTDVAMEDFNQTFMMRAVVTEAPPMLHPTLMRTGARDKPDGEDKLRDAELLYQVTRYEQADDDCGCVTYDRGYWSVDYPCEPKFFEPQFCKCFICDRSPGMVAPKLKAFYTGEIGSGAEINFILKHFCPSIALAGFGPYFNGAWWYIDSVSVPEDARGAEYKVGEKFVFAYYEDPARGGEASVSAKFIPFGPFIHLQEAVVTAINEEGGITQIELVRAPDEPFDNCTYTYEVVGNSVISYPKVPLYGRYLTHRYAVGLPGNGYVEGDKFRFDIVASPPENLIETGGRFYPYLKTAAKAAQRAIATVLEVDSRGGVVDWYMCGTRNTTPGWGNYRPEAERNCNDYLQTGKYYDLKYENRCEYNYVGFIPVRYAWSGFKDHQFHDRTYCEHAWAEFSFSVDQISVKNEISVVPPPGWATNGKNPVLRIKTIGAMELYGEKIEPIYYQNYEIAVGPSDASYPYTSPLYKNHKIPVEQGSVIAIEVVEPGAGYVKKIENEDGTYTWRPLELATYFTADYPPCKAGCVPAMFIRGVTDDIRKYMNTEYGWPTFCHFKAEIITDVPEDHPNFGGIRRVEIVQKGLWYFKHTYDHVWLARAGSNWYFELAEPANEGQPPSRGLDRSEYFSYDCWHASRDNWGEMHHYDGFYEPYDSGYHRQPIYTDQLIGYGYGCEVITDQSESRFEWPVNRPSITGNPGRAAAGDYRNRWSLNFCPHDLFDKGFRMILVHPCAACAKELSIPGSQTCWNMAGFGDTTHAMYADDWRGTGTAFVTKLAGSLIFRTSIPTVA